MDTITTDLRYPIGRYEPVAWSEKSKETFLSEIRFLPESVEVSIQNLNEDQLKTPYREGGWTVHQLVHHIADSHMNGYIRCKLAYTEDNPSIKPYDENAWSHLSDVQLLPVNLSITILHALHRRWYEFLRHVGNDDWTRTVFHPEHQKQMTLWYLLGQYAWHGKHHVAHITSLRERMGWN